MRWWGREVSRQNALLSSGRGRLQFAIYVAILGGLIWGGAHALTQVTSTVAALCDYPVGDERLQPAWWIPLAGIVGVFAGRYLNRLRVDSKRQPVASSSSGKADRTQGTTLAMLGVFVVMVAIWFYEAVGTAHVRVHEGGIAVFEPITYYIRCAAIVDRAEMDLSPWSMVTVFLIGLVAGDWFWSSNRANADERNEINEKKRERIKQGPSKAPRPEETT